jgi:hypothetical protein
MTEPTITCPSCKTEIKLTESLAAPLIETTRRDYEQRLAQKEAESSKREADIREREAALSKSKAALDEQVAERLKVECTRIALEESKKAKLAVAQDFEQQSKDLAEAQQAQADLLRKQRELDDAKRELDLTVEKRVQEGLTATRDQAKKEVEEALKFKVMEKEQTITSMQKQIEELKRRAEQGSQQLQGEVQELELEALLTSKFPQDQIQPVAKGEYGGDVLHRVAGSFGQPCGTILWESKRTKNWSDGWLAKLREDQRQAKAEIAIIVSQALPKEVETFEFIDGVWVTHPKEALPLAMALRQGLVEVAAGGRLLLDARGSGQRTESYDEAMGQARRANRAGDASHRRHVWRPPGHRW